MITIVVFAPSSCRFLSPSSISSSLRPLSYILSSASSALWASPRAASFLRLALPRALLSFSRFLSFLFFFFFCSSPFGRLPSFWACSLTFRSRSLLRILTSISFDLLSLSHCRPALVSRPPVPSPPPKSRHRSIPSSFVRLSTQPFDKPPNRCWIACGPVTPRLLSPSLSSSWFVVWVVVVVVVVGRPSSVR